MEATKRVVILLVLGLLTACPAQSAEKPSTEIVGTRTASCLVKITSDPAVLPLNFETVDSLLHSSGVGGRAARDVLGLAREAEDRVGAGRSKEFVSTIVDLRILAHLAEYHSHRALAGVDWALFEQSRDLNALDDAIENETRAVHRGWDSRCYREQGNQDGREAENRA